MSIAIESAPFQKSTSMHYACEDNYYELKNVDGIPMESLDILMKHACMYICMYDHIFW